MRKGFIKMLCLLTALTLLLSACMQKPPQELRYCEKALSVKNFEAYKNKIKARLDEINVDYDFYEFAIPDDPENPEAPYMEVYSFEIKGDRPAKLMLGLTNENKVESFILTLEFKRDKIENCDLKLKKYTYFREILQIISDLEVSKRDLNSVIRSGQKGSVKAFENSAGVFNVKKEKTLYKKDGYERTADYSIEYDSVVNPPVFTESLTVKGLLSILKDQSDY